MSPFSGKVIKTETFPPVQAFRKKTVNSGRVKDDTLTLEAQREARGGEKLKVSKRYYLPKGVEISKLSASLKNGILLIELPKVKEATPVSIAIE